ncbi:MAG: SUMF1/EgtB/PvdO family nonheme iron enzyme [Lysobacterales bacterium]
MLRALQELSWTGPVLLASQEACFVRQRVVELAGKGEVSVSAEAVPEPPAPVTLPEQDAKQDRPRFESQWIVTEDRALAQLPPLQRETPPLPPLDRGQIKAERDRVGSSVVRGQWPWLRRRLRQALNPLNQRNRQPIDFEHLGQQLATGTVPGVWPRRRLERWPGGMTLLLDERPLLGVLQGEFDHLASRLRRSIGSRSVRLLHRKLDSDVLPRTPGPAPLLVVTDLAGLSPDTLRWFKEQARNQSAPVVLCPEPGPCIAVEQIALGPRAPADQGALTPLLALIDAFGYVDDRLLKALVEDQCPGRSSWRHLLALLRNPMIEHFHGDHGFGITECRSELRAASPDAAGLPAARIARAMQLMQRLHGLEGATNYYSGMLRCASRYLCALPALSRQLDLADHYFLQQAEAKLRDTPDPALALRVLRALRSQAPLREKDRYAQLMERAVAVTELEWDAAPPQSVPRRAHVLRAIGSQLSVSPDADGPLRRAVLARDLQLPERGASVSAVLGRERRVVYLRDQGSHAIDGGEHSHLGLVAGERLIQLTRIQRPSWAVGWGRDLQGAYVLAPSPLGKPHRFRIHEREGEHPISPLFPADTQEVLEALPSGPWANLAIGIDRFGLFTSIEVKGATQRLRWIEPGSFQMGSEPNDMAAFDDEKPRHEVRISRGFWLANTVCSQAFWMAVAGGRNPSHFVGKNRPVERVSIRDVNMRFLTRLGGLLDMKPHLDRPNPRRAPRFESNQLALDLPSEAEWEYSCRAGTISPFSFGNHPNTMDAFGLFESLNTVEVASMPPNPWGLYGMHGNVWEWCRDGMRRYGTLSMTDPEGPESDRRAVRGGSWADLTEDARSARRFWSLDNSHHSDLGFRWCMRPIS